MRVLSLFSVVVLHGLLSFYPTILIAFACIDHAAQRQCGPINPLGIVGTVKEY